MNYLLEQAASINRREAIVFILFTGCYVFGFLVFFQPFGINNYDPGETITPLFLAMVALFGALVSLLLAINQFILAPLVLRSPPRWQVALWFAWSIVWVASGIFLLYNWLGDWHDFHWRSYLGFIGNLGVLGLLPIIGLLAYVHIRDLQNTLNLEISARPATTREGLALITFTAENGKDRFALPLDQLLYIQADDNYVTIHFLEDNQPRQQLLRKSLKAIQDEKLHPALFRCHRSCIINTGRITHVAGNRQRLSVRLSGMAMTLPVSRQYAGELYDRYA